MSSQAVRNLIVKSAKDSLSLYFRPFASMDFQDELEANYKKKFHAQKLKFKSIRILLAINFAALLFAIFSTFFFSLNRDWFIEHVNSIKDFSLLAFPTLIGVACILIFQNVRRIRRERHEILENIRLENERLNEIEYIVKALARKENIDPESMLVHK